MSYYVDQNIVSALQNWLLYGLYPGSCAYLLLLGEYDEAKKHAHKLILPHWEEHIRLVESLPEECRGVYTSHWPEVLKKKVKKTSAKL